MSYLYSGWFNLVLGSLAIALGGYLTTRGWNQLNSYDERQSLLSSLKREWRQNDIYFDDFEISKHNVEKLQQPLSMPTFLHTAVDQLLVSPLFDEHSSDDSALLDAASSYVRNVTPTNDSISAINNRMPFRSMDDNRTDLKGFLNSNLLVRFARRHREMADQLKLTTIHGAADPIPALHKSELPRGISPDDAYSTKEGKN